MLAAVFAAAHAAIIQCDNNAQCRSHGDVDAVCEPATSRCTCSTGFSKPADASNRGVHVELCVPSTALGQPTAQDIVVAHTQFAIYFAEGDINALTTSERGQLNRELNEYFGRTFTLDWSTLAEGKTLVAAGSGYLPLKNFYKLHNTWFQEFVAQKTNVVFPKTFGSKVSSVITLNRDHCLSPMPGAVSSVRVPAASSSPCVVTQCESPYHRHPTAGRCTSALVKVVNDVDDDLDDAQIGGLVIVCFLAFFTLLLFALFFINGKKEKVTLE